MICDRDNCPTVCTQRHSAIGCGLQFWLAAFKSAGHRRVIGLRGTGDVALEH